MSSFHFSAELSERFIGRDIESSGATKDIDGCRHWVEVDSWNTSEFSDAEVFLGFVEAEANVNFRDPRCLLRIEAS